MNVRSFVGCVALTLIMAGCRDEVRTVPLDAGLECGPNERPRFGECVFICDRDTDCESGQRCNVLTGVCEPVPPAPDAGVQQFPCTTGATRCNSGNDAVEYCTESGAWVEQESCDPGMPCINGACQICTPGAARCDDADPGIVHVCIEDGTAERVITCSGSATCTQNQCRECDPETQRCSPNGTTLEACKFTQDETRVWAWSPSGDGFDGSCITGQCVEGPPAACFPPDCLPGAVRCINESTQELCSDTGSWTQVPCSTFGSTYDCLGQSCVDVCTHAASLKSYFGCEYWTAVQDNGLDKVFKNMPMHTDLRQGTTDSDFAFVVSNRSDKAANVNVYRWMGGQEVLVRAVTVQGRSDPISKGLATIKVPWQSIGHTDQTFVTVSQSGRARFGYRLTSDRPVTVYQFNPLDALRTGVTTTTNESCIFNSDCVSGTNGSCSFSTFTCSYTNSTFYTYSNDASLLLPAHILGTSYVAISQEHAHFSSAGTEQPINGHITIVAAHDNTQVTVKSSANTLASPSQFSPAVPALSKNQSHTFTLNRYEVLQLGTSSVGANIAGSCISGICRKDNDLTGSVVSSDKPVALFGGAACANKPHNLGACDHLEEQIFPFTTWGKTYVAQKSHPVRVSGGGFASTSQMGADYFKIVASCPANTCPNGTLITFSTPPAAGDVLAPNRCLGGTSLASNNCRLAGGDFMEFRSKGTFTVTGDQPIAVAQFFPGQAATTNAVTGDPSLILLPPAEQWRDEYTVLTAPGIADNFLGIVYDDTKVGSVEVDGVVISGFNPVGTTSYRSKNHPVAAGSHTIKVNPKQGSSQAPSAGVIVYGFDSFVSYGYTGGLDLGSIVTGIDPGG